jgi:hypothetical protein
VESPVSNVTSPDNDAEPLKISILPLVPVPEPDEISISPLLFELEPLAPLMREILPPVLLVDSPATRSILDPSPLPLLPTDNVIEPAAFDAPPVDIMISPVDPALDVPDSTLTLPELAVDE